MSDCLNSEINYVERKIEFMQKRLQIMTTEHCSIRGHKINEKVEQQRIVIKHFQDNLKLLQSGEQKTEHIHESLNEPTEMIPEPKQNTGYEDENFAV